MSVIQFVVTAATSVVVTIPVVLLIPRARQSSQFDRVLWLGTWAIAMLGTWYTLGNVQIPSLDVLTAGDVSIVRALAGGAAAALILNGLLWGIDRFEHPQAELEEEEAETGDGSLPPSPGVEASEAGANSADSAQIG